MKNVHIIKNRLKPAYSHQKPFVDHSIKQLEFEEGDKVYLKISPMKEVIRFYKKWKLSPRYVDPYEIFQKYGKVSYESKHPSELADGSSNFPCVHA